MHDIDCKILFSLCFELFNKPLQIKVCNHLNTVIQSMEKLIVTVYQDVNDKEFFK